MENKDKQLYNQFKDAAHKAETKGFDRMEAVWARVEDKLDNKKQRRIALWWKYTGIAALFLLFMGVGLFMLNNNSNTIITPSNTPQNNITVIDTVAVEKTFSPENETVKEEVVITPQKSSVVIKKDKLQPVVEKQGELEKTLADKSGDDSDLNEIVVTTKPAVTNNKEIVFNGTITDSQSLPIPGASIIVGGKTVVTDFDGKYNIQATIGDTIIAKYVGMSTSKIVAAPATNNSTIALHDDVNLAGIVIEGYRTTSRARSSAAVTTITTGKSKRAQRKEQELKKEAITITSQTIEGKPNQSFVQSLQGQVPGLKITTASGDPGSTNSTVILRGLGSLNGNAEPLYVIDGVPSNLLNFRTINSKYVKSVNVLKGTEATSLYGNRGANGVIIITTKNLTRKQKREIRRAQKKNGNIEESDTTAIPFAPIEKIKIDHEEYESFEENKFENPATTPLSTFSIDVDNASYTNIRRFLNNGEVVPKDAVRVEEMINFFKYNYPQPTGTDPFSINTEYSDAPWNPNHKLLKIGLQGKEIPTLELPASNFVFIIDVSGSMNSSNKLPLLKQSMKLLVNQMRKQDKIAIVVYAGAAGLVLPPTGGDEKATIIAALDKLESGGSTAGGAGIELAYKTAQENFVKNGNNRVILATDGDFNVGASSDSDMQTLIEEKRKSGVFLTCLGYGMGNYKDAKLETLADKGNGNYAYIDTMQEADRYLNKEFKGSMYAIAKDVKIQIEFNPKFVQSYRLIGYENRKLRDEDFANDAIDAGELGSGHTVTALYEIIPTGVKSDYFNSAPQLKYTTPQKATENFGNELATIKFRHKKPNEDVSKEMVKVIDNTAITLTNTSADYKFAAAVAWFGLKLRDSKLVPNKSTQAIIDLAKQGLQNDTEGYRAEFIRLVQMVE